MAKALARRFVLNAVLLGAAGVAVVAGTAAQAATEPTAVAIIGEGLPEPVIIEADSDPNRFAAILDQVDWLRAGVGHPPPPKGEDLGPKYTVIVLFDGIPAETYDLYPLAPGGPRAFRPAGQYDERTTAAWFFGRLDMPEALRAAGAPLPERHDELGGLDTPEPRRSDDSFAASERLGDLLADLRLLLILDAAVVLAIAAGLAGVSFMLRSRG
jgi:hypothetical protein